DINKNIFKNLKELDVSTILFVVQWILLFVVALIFYIKFLKTKKKEEGEEKIEMKRKKGGGKSHTDLDDLYELLKEKKVLKIPVIAKSFNIDKEKAFEWCKILEENNLVNINFPPFSEPEVVIKENG
ncbi:hypothetical protein DRN69_07930, partial [Candidatus Pacearchaeota archaeon]